MILPRTAHEAKTAQIEQFQPYARLCCELLEDPDCSDEKRTGIAEDRAIRHNILEFCARVLASSRVTAQDSTVALLDLRGAVGLALWVTVAMIES